MSTAASTAETATPEEQQRYYQLTPDRVLDAVEVDGRHCTGRFIVLNSYENRVYQLELDDGRFVVAKFYRPGRWSTEAILDEHEFLIDLEEAEIPVAAPFDLPGGDSLEELHGIRYALFPTRAGELTVDPAHLEIAGDPFDRFFGRRTLRPRGTTVNVGTWTRWKWTSFLESALPRART